MCVFLVWSLSYGFHKGIVFGCVECLKILFYWLSVYLDFVSSLSSSSCLVLIFSACKI